MTEPLTPTVNSTTFRSGCGNVNLCTDYYKVPTQVGGSDNLYDISYSTQGGSSKSCKKCKKCTKMKCVCKKTAIKSKKTSSKSKKVVKKQKGGFSESEENTNESTNTDYSTDYASIINSLSNLKKDQFQSVNVMGGGLKQSKKLKNFKGGFAPLEPSSEEDNLSNYYNSMGMDNMMSSRSNSLPLNNMPMQTYKMSGGADVKDDVLGFNSNEMLFSFVNEENNQSGGRSKKSVKKVKKVKKVKSSRKIKGGFAPLEESDFNFNRNYSTLSGGNATPMNPRFYDENAHLDDYSELSGNGIKSAYGLIESGDIGTGMLAPYTASKCESADRNTMTQTGGKKMKSKKSVSKKSTKSKKTVKPKKSKGKKSLKGGNATPMHPRFYDENAYLDDYAELSGNGVQTEYGTIEVGDVGTGLLAPYNVASCKQNGGNATPMHPRFYDENAHLDDYAELSGDGVKTEYGTIEVGDVGTGLLAPYNVASCKQNGGSGPIPSISSSPVKMVENTITGAIDGFSKFMNDFNKKYLQSVDNIKNMKIGNQRLVGGRSKLRKNNKMSGGSNGSDWATSQGSRGPENSPNDYWGVPGEQWFRQFNKTGDYIPNDQLKYAATPELAGVGKNEVVDAYDPLGTVYGHIGGKAKSKSPKSKSKSPKAKSKSPKSKSKSPKSKSSKK
jgi:hypothetical protein